MIINGNLEIFSNDGLNSLGELKKINGFLNLYKCKNIKSLGKLKTVEGFLNINDCENLEDLGDLEEVKENIYLENTKITKSKLWELKPKLMHKCIWEYNQDYLYENDFQI